MAFNLLPIELNGDIARYLETDKDIYSFLRICHATRDAIDGDNKSFWRHHFLKVYDPTRYYVAGRAKDPQVTHQLRLTENEHFKETYIKRKQLLHSSQIARPKSRKGTDPWQTIKDLINEQFYGGSGVDAFGRRTSRNTEFLHELVRRTNIVSNFLPRKARNTPTPLMEAIHICMASWMLSHENQLATWQFDVTQTMVYSPASAHPLFIGQDRHNVNLTLVTHFLNFFRKHTSANSTAEWPLQRALKELKTTDNPQPPSGVLHPGRVKLGPNWKGTYAYLDPKDIKKLRRGDAADGDAGEYTDCHITDESAKGPIQTLNIDFPDRPNRQNIFWPEEFNRIIPAPRRQMLVAQAPKRARVHTPAQPQGASQQASSATGLQSPPTSPDGKPAVPAKAKAARVAHDPMHNFPMWFVGEGVDDESFHSTGFTHTLPPQQGINGWQRLCMMKYYRDRNGFVDMEALWAYEGVVVPGGKIVLGRWWAVDLAVYFPHLRLAPQEISEYSGPFILWETEGDKGVKAAN